jgi:hypothetical protein
MLGTPLLGLLKAGLAGSSILCCHVDKQEELYLKRDSSYVNKLIW